MRKCLKILNLLIEKKVAETEGDKLKVQKYQGMIKRHLENCPDCRAFLKGMRQKTKREGVRKIKKILVKDKCMSRLCCLFGFLALSSLAFVYMLTGGAEPDPYFHLIFKTVLLHGLICWTVTALFLVFLLLFVRVESDEAKMNKK